MRATALALLAAARGAAAAWHYYPNTNAVNGCGMACSSHGTYVCLGTVQSWPACQSLCAAAGSSCTLLTWSNGTGNCWTRSLLTWEPTPAPGDTAGCDDAAVPDCAPRPPWNGTSINVTVGAAINGGTTDALSPAVTLDLWRADDSRFGEKWGNSSALTIDLGDAQLLALTAAVGPGLLRIGGSPEDSIVFDADGTCVPQSGGKGPFPGYYCSQVSPYVYDCLTPSRWEALLGYVAGTGMKLVLGLNGCYGRPNASAPMDLSNVKALLAATVASPHAAALWGVELSNEVVPNTISPAAWAADAAAIKALAASIFGAAGLPTPKLAGPDQGGCAALGAVAAAVPPGTLDALTYHEYPECTAPNVPDGFLLDPRCLASLDAQAAQCVAAAAAGAQHPPPAVWAGETADHSGGGIANLTDTFRSSFYYAWQLGALPAAGVALAARQALSGGDYELLTRADYGAGRFAPNPDYWVAWLFRALVGGGATARAVAMSVPVNASGVRLFAFATVGGSGGTTLLALNLQDGSGGGGSGVTPQPVALQLAGAGVGGAPRVEYHLASAAPGGLGAPLPPHGPVAVNGRLLAVDPASHAPPPVATLGVPAPAGSPLVVAPSTIVFATVG